MLKTSINAVNMKVISPVVEIGPMTSRSHGLGLFPHGIIGGYRSSNCRKTCLSLLALGVVRELLIL